MTRPLNNSYPLGSVTTSDLVVYQGPDIPCLHLCKGDTVSKVINKLATKFCNLLDSLGIDKYDFSCLSVGPCEPKTFQELIQLIITSICEIQLLQGPAGANGNYINVENLVPGVTCPGGGVTITLYNGITNEATDTFTICNGADGEDGLNGVNGNYVDVVAATVEECPGGGIVITLHNGTTDEVISTNIVCTPECDCLDCTGFTVGISETEGDLIATPAGGTAPYTYQWETNDINFSTGVSDFTIFGSSTSQTVVVNASSGVIIEPATTFFSGMMKVTVIDANGCVATDYFHIKDVILS